MGVSKTSLSAGNIINKILTENAEVASKTRLIFPIVVDKAQLPYIVYRRVGLDQNPVKGRRGSDSVTIDVVCYTKGYTEGVELAEAVRDALEGEQIEADGLVMRSCYLSDSEETWADDAYIQSLTFTIKI